MLGVGHGSWRTAPYLQQNELPIPPELLVHFSGWA
jgi:hypothetical protein